MPGVWRLALVLKPVGTWAGIPELTALLASHVIVIVPQMFLDSAFSNEHD